MAQGPSPLLGYNTNVRHKGKLYHIQTEDSGINHPHIITHLFADGGRIVASKKTSYAEQLGIEDLKTVVKKMMQDQHKAMFIALRDGVYDESEGLAEPGKPVVATHAAPASIAPAIAAAPVPVAAASAAGAVDIDALERAAARLAGAAEGPRTGTSAAVPNRYSPTRPAAVAAPKFKSKPPESIFGSDLLSEKSLDEVILSYLATDLDEND